MKKNIQTKYKTYQLSFTDMFFLHIQWTDNVQSDCLEGAVLKFLKGRKLISIEEVKFNYDCRGTCIKVEYEYISKFSHIIKDYIVPPPQVSYIKYREL